MYAVVQIGSRIARFECGTTTSVVSARASGVPKVPANAAATASVASVRLTIM